MNLDDNQRSQIISIRLMPGYTTILDILENECDKAEADLVNLESWDKEKIFRYQVRANSFRTLFTNFQKIVEAAVVHDGTVPETNVALKDYIKIAYGQY